VKDALRARLADAVDVLADLDALVEHGADGMPPLLLARVLIRLDDIAVRLVRLRQALTATLADPSAPETRQTADHATGQASGDEPR
jgi:hypothetical protein